MTPDPETGLPMKHEIPTGCLEHGHDWTSPELFTYRDSETGDTGSEIHKECRRCGRIAIDRFPHRPHSA